MAFAYVGTCLMPPGFQCSRQHISPSGLYPVFLMAILILMVVMAERMHRVTAEKRNSYKANVIRYSAANGPLGSNSGILRTKATSDRVTPDQMYFVELHFSSTLIKLFHQILHQVF